MEKIILDVLILLASLGGLWISANWVVEAASIIARKIGMSDLVIGLTVVALGTSAPEFVVTIFAALEGKAGISVGNIIGSNIFNLGIILGGIAIIKPLTVEKVTAYRDTLLLFIGGMLLLLFSLDGQLVPWEGAIMAIILVVYLAVLFIKKEHIPLEDEIVEKPYHWWRILQLLAGLGLIVLSGQFLVSSATEIALFAGMSEWLVGVTIVAAGTSAPELVTSFVAVVKGRMGMSVGNLIGSDLFNVLGVLGVASILNPLNIDDAILRSMMLMSGSVLILFVIMRTNFKISRAEGGLLVFIALLRWAIDFLY